MENYVLYDEIGRGEGTIVYKGRRKGTINFVAIYCIEKQIRAEITNRVRLTHELAHENVVKFHEWYETSNHLWIVVELCTGGTLRQLIEQDQCLPEVCIRKFGKCILRGLYYLHSIGIVVCNLTSNKVLLDGSGQLKISDFSVSRVQGEDLLTVFQQTCEDFEDQAEVVRSRVAPDRLYAAPEFLVHSTLTPASDLWSFGCILYEMFTGTPPFSSLDDDLEKQVESAAFPSPRARVLSAQHTERPSKELKHLMNSLLTLDPAKRIDWSALINHPFWKSGGVLGETIDRPITLVTGEQSVSEEPSLKFDTMGGTTKLAESLRMTQELRSSLRPKTGEDPKLGNVTSGVSATAINAPHHIVPLSARSGKSAAPSSKGKGDAAENMQFTPRSESNLEVSEWKKLIYTSSDLSTTPIIDNPKIVKSTSSKFDSKQLPGSALQLESVSQMSSEDLKTHLKPLVEALAVSEKNGTVYKNKLNISSYLMTICCESACNLLINHYRLLNTVTTHVKVNSNAEMRTKYCRLIGLVALNCTRVSHGVKLMEVIVILTEFLRDNFRNVKMKQSALPAIGQVLFLIASQEEKEGSSIDSWTIPSISFTMVSRCLREGEEQVIQHFSAKIIENVAATTGVHSNKFSTTEVALLLWNLHGKSTVDALKVTSISALARINKLNTSLFPSVIDKVGLPNVLDTISVNSKVLQPVLTMLLTMLAHGHHLGRLSQDKDLVTRILKLLESPSANTRAKVFLLLLVIAENNKEMLSFMCSQRLIAHIERDHKKQNTARAEGQASLQYLNQCLDQLIQKICAIFPVILQDATATLDSVSGRKHPSTLQMKEMKTSVPLLSICVSLVTSQVFRQSVVDGESIIKFGQLFTHMQQVDAGQTSMDVPMGNGSNSPNLSDEFKRICLNLAEALVKHPETVVAFCGEIVDCVFQPLSLLVAKSDNSDVRLTALLILSEATSIVIHHCHDSPAEETSRTSQKVLDNFLENLLPDFEHVLISQEPMPAYALNVLSTIIEEFPGVMKKVEEAGLVSIMFQIMGEYEENMTGAVMLNLVKNISVMVSCKATNLELMYEQGLADRLCNILVPTIKLISSSESKPKEASNGGTLVDKDLKALIILAVATLETLQNLLKHASNVVRVTLQQKNTNKDHDTSTAEALLLRNKVFMQLVQWLLHLLSCSDKEVQELTCNILFILVQLYGGATEDTSVTSPDGLMLIRNALESLDLKNQRVLLRVFKRVLSSDANHISRVRESPEGLRLLETVEKLSANNDATVTSVANEVLKLTKPSS